MSNEISRGGIVPSKPGLNIDIKVDSLTPAQKKAAEKRALTRMLKEIDNANSQIIDLQKKSKKNKTDLEGLTNKREELEKTVKDYLRKGHKLSDPILDYCVYHFGAQAGSKIGGVNSFILTFPPVIVTPPATAFIAYSPFVQLVLLLRFI